MQTKFFLSQALRSAKGICRETFNKIGLILGKSTPAATLLAAALILVPLRSVASANPVIWDPDGAQMSGSGCAKDTDAYAIGFGADVSLVFTNLGFNLGSGGSGELSGAKTCNVKIPATAPGGSYLARLDQSLLYGIIKSAGSEGSLRVQGKFFGLQFRTPEIDFSRGEVLSDPQRAKSRSDVFNPAQSRAWVQQWCKRQRAPKGELQLHIKVQAKADSQNEDMIVFVDGMDLRYEILTDLSTCP